MRIKFLRRNTKDYSKLGKKRKKLQKWRSPKGRDNKMRLREKGYPRTVEVGYKKDKTLSGKIDGKEVAVIKNLTDLELAGKNKTLMLAKIGKKKKIEIAKKAKELGLKIKNLDIEKAINEEIKPKAVKK